MTKPDFLLLLITISVNSVASLLVKKGASAIVGGMRFGEAGGMAKMLLQALNVYTVLGLALLGLGFVMYVALVSRVQVSIAQAMLSLAYIFVAVGASVFFGEALTLQKIFGIGVIIVGVYFISGGIK